MASANTPSRTHTCTAPGCGRPAPDTFICRTCSDQLKADLLDIPELFTDLIITMAKWDESGDVSIREPGLDPEITDQPIAEQPLPYHPGAGDVIRDLHNELHAAVRDIVETRYGTELDGWARDRAARVAGAAGPWRRAPQLPDDDTAELARWLARHMETIKGDEGSGQLVADVARRVEAARRVIYPERYEYMGPCVHCTCGDQRCRGGHPPATDLYVRRLAIYVSCPVCGGSWPTDDRRRWLLDRARPQLLTAVEASRALPALLEDIMPGKPLTAAMIRGYGHRGRLTRHKPHPHDWAVDDQGRPVEPQTRYQVGELMDLVLKLRKDEQAEADRRARTATTR